METMTQQVKKAEPASTVITPAEVLEHWQGHRRLTRKVIEVFPEDKLFTYSIGGMRPFAELVTEFIEMAEPGITGVATGKWKAYGKSWQDAGSEKPKNKKELLERWDKVTDKLNETWAQIPVQRFREKDIAFGQWEGAVYSFIQYWVDNEIHHRGQGYVYLRSLGIEPPAFWDRQ
jgi:uncharacterized damage-inducible protein DinB